MNEMQSNKLHVKKLLSEEEVIDHVRLHTKNLALDNVPRTHRNIYPTICSTNFALSRSSLNESEHISAGKKLISMLQKLDQFSKLNIKLGSKVAIINYQLQGDWCELWGFTTPKTITKILKDNDDAITRFEFNNDSDDYWPRTEHAEYKGNLITNTAFFADKTSAEKAVSLTMLRFSDVLTIKNAIKENKERMTESNSEYDDEAGMAENNLETLKRAVEGIDDLINPGDNLPEWCQEKIAVAKSMLVSVWDYMKSEENSDEVEPEIDRMFEALDQAMNKLEKYKVELQQFIPDLIDSYKEEGFDVTEDQLAEAIKVAHDTMERTGDEIKATNALDAVLEAYAEVSVNKIKIDFHQNLGIVLKQKYPNTEFIIKPDRVESADGLLTVIAGTQKEGKYVGCWMWDVNTGPYKGALAIAIKQTTDQLLQANPGKKPALFIGGDNDNPEAWSYIAKKFRYKLIADEDLDENVNESTEHLEKAKQYKAHLIKTAPRVMDFLSKSVKGWRPSKQEMLDAIDTAYIVMKHTGDVKQAGKAMMDELNTLHRMSQGKDLNETAAWKRKEGKNKNGGLNAKGVASYRRENPCSKLQTAVTTKPSKLDPDSKAAKRRKSFCARMGGMEGPMKDEKGEPTRKALALKKWNC
jgi:hypothetical protein